MFLQELHVRADKTGIVYNAAFIMTLSRKVLLCDLGLLLGLLLLAGTAVLGLLRIDRHGEIAAQEYRELRQMNGASIRLAAAMALLQADPPRPDRAIEEVRMALSEMEAFQSIQASSDEGSEGHEQRETSTIERSLRRLKEVVANLTTNQPPSIQADRELLASIQTQFQHLMREADRLVGQTQARSSRAVNEALVTIAVTLVIIIAIGSAISIGQYRSVIRPLRALRAGAAEIASGRFDRRINISADQEFLQLRDDFNRMAAELDEMYRNLEQKVATKSRELVQAERLASVGFLAAGVAHEINNPLGIMSGFAELSLKRLRTQSDPASVEDARNTLQIIRDEAFRCREITERLLALAKGSGSRGPVSLSGVASDVISMLAAHRHYRGRSIHLDAGDDSHVVNGDESELKQVMLNLLTNALHATEANTGDVRVRLRRAGDSVELTVRDQGCGMTPEVCRQVFEPFFSGRRGEQRGIGLGLSISHAIVESHGGTMTADSDGPDRGSCFTLRLPVAAPEAAQI